MLRKHVTRDGERIFDEQRAEERFRAADFRLQVEFHAGFALQNDFQTVGAAAGAHAEVFLELNGDACIPSFKAFSHANVERNTIEVRIARAQLQCDERVRA